MFGSAPKYDFDIKMRKLMLKIDVKNWCQKDVIHEGHRKPPVIRHNFLALVIRAEFPVGYARKRYLTSYGNRL